MRPVLILAALLSTMLRLCGNDDAAPPPVATATVAAPSIDNGPPMAARHGGTVVAVGVHRVEVVPHTDGHIEAYVTDAQGGVPPPAGMMLVVNVKGADGTDYPARVAWSPADLRFEGRVTGTTLVPGPVTVELTRPEGPPEVAVAPLVVIVPPAPAVHVVAPSGAVVVNGPQAGVVVNGPQAGVVVNGPQAGVVVNGPQAGVVVEQPAGVIVEGPRAGVIVTGPAVGVEVREPVFLAPPPPVVEVGFGVNIGGGIGVVEEDGRRHGHDHDHEEHFEEHGPRGNAWGFRGEHGGHGHGH